MRRLQSHQRSYRFLWDYQNCFFASSWVSAVSNTKTVIYCEKGSQAESAQVWTSGTLVRLQAEGSGITDFAFRLQLAATA